MAAYATYQDLQKRWSSMPADLDQDTVTLFLEDASTLLRAWYPDVDARIAAGTLDDEAVKIIVCGMVRRALERPDDRDPGVTQRTDTTGPFSQTFQYRDADAVLYLTKNDRRILGGSARNRKAFTTHPAPARRPGPAVMSEREYLGW
ncbi:Gp19/Gp15/Gp42 family protein [Zhihengliuella flava]|uniref:Uncharacterized protein n=1 Tax=Zhihengliuella flava TaxID=1285193 RepID=A0A931D6E5_9MICC|nr:Gp19/Gp15/Gp42 family protein [Zhihengliuella flava]MBG6083242.1 hypothetical protein [Zhihengliuella flava]